MSNDTNKKKDDFDLFSAGSEGTGRRRRAAAATPRRGGGPSGPAMSGGRGPSGPAMSGKIKSDQAAPSTRRRRSSDDQDLRSLYN